MGLGWTAVAILALALGCRGGTGEDDRPRIETVDVAPSLEITTEGDQTEAERPPSLVGLMPGDFPPDLPLQLARVCPAARDPSKSRRLSAQASQHQVLQLNAWLTKWCWVERFWVRNWQELVKKRERRT